MRCRSCNLRLEAFDNHTYCKRCIKASEDTTTEWKDPQHKLITDTSKGCVVTGVRGSKE